MGPCRGNFSRWSYDKDTMSCREFGWGGCHGNDNNFLTERECHLRCKDSGRSRGKCSYPSNPPRHSLLLLLPLYSLEIKNLLFNQIIIDLICSLQFNVNYLISWKSDEIELNFLNLKMNNLIFNQMIID